MSSGGGTARIPSVPGATGSSAEVFLGPPASSQSSLGTQAATQPMLRSAVAVARARAVVSANASAASLASQSFRDRMNAGKLRRRAQDDAEYDSIASIPDAATGSSAEVFLGPPASSQFSLGTQASTQPMLRSAVGAARARASPLASASAASSASQSGKRKSAQDEAEFDDWDDMDDEEAAALGETRSQMTRGKRRAASRAAKRRAAAEFLSASEDEEENEGSIADVSMDDSVDEAIGHLDAEARTVLEEVLLPDQPGGGSPAVEMLPRRSDRIARVVDAGAGAAAAAAMAAAAAAAAAAESTGTRARRWGLWRDDGETDSAFARRVKKFGAALEEAASRDEVSRYDLLRPGSGADALLTEQPLVTADLFEAAGAASGGDSSDDEFIESSGERAGADARQHAADVARQKLKLEFAYRQFDVERLSMRYCVCQMCGRAVVQGGVVTQVREAAQNAQMLFSHSKQKRRQPFLNVLRGIYEIKKKGFNGAGYRAINMWCKQCDTSLNKKQVPPFSEVNFGHGIEVPFELRGLTYAEQQCCSLIQPVMACFKVVGSGHRAMRGHVCFLSREDELLEMVSVLPRIKLDAAVLRRDAPNGAVKRLRVRRQVVLVALRWLCEHSPAYRGVTIDNVENIIRVFDFHRRSLLYQPLAMRPIDASRRLASRTLNSIGL